MPAIQTRKGWRKRLMLSLPTKETAYGTAPTVSAANYQLMTGFTLEPDPQDVVEHDGDQITGSEQATYQEIVEYRTNLPYVQERGTPNALAGLAALVAGSVAATQDGAYNAYRHYISPCSADTALASIGAVLDPQNDQQTIHGLKGASFKLTGEVEQSFGIEANLVSSGKRTDTSETWQAAVSEVLLKMRDTKFYVKENPVAATDIVTPANLSQTTPNIDGGSPSITTQGAYLKSISFEHNNNGEGIPGAGGAGYYQDWDFGKRGYTFTLSMLYQDDTWKDYFLNQTPLALELNCKSGTLIDASGSFYYGFILRIPLCKLSKMPEPKGGPTDMYTMDVEVNILTDGTNPLYDLAVYTALDAYLA